MNLPLYVGLMMFSVTEFRERLFINGKKVEMSASAVIRIVRATKRNDVNDKSVFPGFGGLAGNNITQALPRWGVGRGISLCTIDYICKEPCLTLFISFPSPPRPQENM